MRKTPHDVLVERLEERLAACKISGTEAAKAATLGHSFVNDIISGRTQMPALSRLEKLAPVLKTNVEYLVGSAPPRPKIVGTDEKAVEVASDTSAKSAVVAAPGAVKLYLPQWPDADGFFAMEAGDEVANSAIDVGGGGFAIMVPDDLNAPRYRAGELVFASPRRPIAKGAFVVIQLRNRGAIREVLSVTADALELHTLSEPSKKTTIKRAEITSIARITGSREV